MSTADFGREQRVTLLQRLADGELEVLSPESNLAAASGHCYEPVRALFEVRPGEEIKQLEYLAELGYLERAFFDRIHLCVCERHQFAINFREICPRCESSQIELVDRIHHFSCGYTGTETEYRDGIRYVCPKCATELRHIGVDYEKVATNYQCVPCGQVFTDPDVNCRCLACPRMFGVEQAQLQTLHVYRISPKGAVAAARGVIDADASSARLLDADLFVYSFSYFEERLAQEFAGALRYKRALSLVALSIDRLDEYEANHGRQEAALLLREFAGYAKESLRDSDAASVYDQTTLLLMLADTPAGGAAVVAERLRRYGTRLGRDDRPPALTISASYASFDPAISGPQALFELAIERLVDARDRGGDRVVPAAAV